MGQLPTNEVPQNRLAEALAHGVIYQEDEAEGASNGGGGGMRVCVDGRVHLALSYGWYDQTGDEKHSHYSESARVIGLCDGCCGQRTLELSIAQKALVSEFVATGKCGESHKDTPMYPNAPHDFEQCESTEEQTLRQQANQRFRQSRR